MKLGVFKNYSNHELVYIKGKNKLVQYFLTKLILKK